MMAQTNLARVLPLMLSMSLLTIVQARASSSRPIEVKSDPYGVGNPTHYSIIRGSSRVTFSHPCAGQFRRAEIVVREKSGTKLTRFLLARDGRSYQPTLQIDTPFEKHFSLIQDDLCKDPTDPGPLEYVKILGPKVDEGAIIAKKRDELVKAGFFDRSCFASNIKQEHRDAIMNAAADVFATETQDGAPEPKYLRCLEKNGFAHESGIVQSLIKQSITKPHPRSRLRLACTSDQKAKPAVFDEEANVITIRTRQKPNRNSYGKIIFHEVLHPIPIRDGYILATAEECCSKGVNCDALRAYSAQRQKGEKTTTAMELVDSKYSVPSSISSILAGPIADSMVFVAPNPTIIENERFSPLPQSETSQCTAMSEQNCKKALEDTIAYVEELTCKAPKSSKPKDKSASRILEVILPSAHASINCDPGFGLQIANLIEAPAAIRKSEKPKTLDELAENIPQTSPISWDVGEVQPVPVRLAGDNETRTNASTPERIPTRTIASVSPLPEPKAQRQLGSMKNRTDVSAGRATAIIDPIEKVARELSARLTPEVLELKKVDRNELFAKDFKPKTATPQFMVVSSVKNPITIADVGDLKNIGFANPFASSGTNSSASSGANSAANSGAKSGSAKGEKTGLGQRSALGKPAIEESRTTDKSRLDSATVFSVGTKPNAQINEPSTPVRTASAPVAANRTTTTPTATNSTATVPGKNKPARSIASSKTQEEFKAMERMDLVRFITSGFRNVSPELENPALAEALVKNKIQILDHENRKIGSMAPEMTFIYRSDLGRLVQTRVDRARK